MDENEKLETAGVEVAEQPKKRRGGRKPMTDEEKQAAAAKRAADKTKADHLKSVVCVQYRNKEADVSSLLDAVKADFRTVKKRMPIKELKLYIKPEENAAYYVINGEYSGKVDF